MPRDICDAERTSIMERFDELKGTIGGKPATIIGRKERFPVVAALDGSGIKLEFSWQALKHRVKHGRVHIKL